MNPSSMPRRNRPLPTPARKVRTWTPPTTYEAKQKIAAHNLANAIKGPTLPSTEAGPYDTTLCFKYSDRLCKTRRMRRSIHSRAKLCLDADTVFALVDEHGGGIAYECISGLGHWHYTPVARSEKDQAAQDRRDRKNDNTWLMQYQ